MNAKLLLFAAVGVAAIASACGSSASTSGSSAADAGPDTHSATATCSSAQGVRRLEDGDCSAAGDYGVDPADFTCCIPCKAGETGVRLGVPTCVPRDSGSDAAASGGSCELTLYPPNYPTRCQTELDKICCNEEKACAGDAACKKVVDCLANCPAPRQDACTNACAPSGVIPPAFDALGACSKSPSFDPDGGTACSYP